MYNAGVRRVLRILFNAATIVSLIVASAVLIVLTGVRV
jgi:hypothetical protein